VLHNELNSSFYRSHKKGISLERVAKLSRLAVVLVANRVAIVFALAFYVSIVCQNKPHVSN